MRLCAYSDARGEQRAKRGGGGWLPSRLKKDPSEAIPFLSKWPDIKKRPNWGSLHCSGLARIHCKASFLSARMTRARY